MPDADFAPSLPKSHVWKATGIWTAGPSASEDEQEEKKLICCEERADLSLSKVKSPLLLELIFHRGAWWGADSGTAALGPSLRVTEWKRYKHYMMEFIANDTTTGDGDKTRTEVGTGMETQLAKEDKVR